MSPDFKDLLSAFNARRVEYLVVGAHALAAHGRVRATGDLDVWVRPESGNATRVLEALASFGAPLRDHGPGGLEQPISGGQGMVRHQPSRTGGTAIVGGLSSGRR